MRGQWQGAYTGYSTGELTIQIDEYDSYFAGRACVFETGNNYGIYVCEFRTADKSDHQRLTVAVRIQRHLEAVDIPRSELSATFPNVDFPTHAEIDLKILNKGLRVSATTYQDTKSLGVILSLLTRGSAEKKSKLIADKKVQSWEKFKKMVGGMDRDRYIFRGQSVVKLLLLMMFEDYLDRIGKVAKKTYLRVFELPFSERDTVLSELRLMGVAAGSLFPGIDGACEEMKLRNFHS